MARKNKEQPPTGTGAEPKRIAPADIQQKEFRLALRGYNERDVDVFLDEVTEEVARLYAENKRLREDLETRNTVRGDTQAAVEADAIIRRARDEAARILSEARAQADRPLPSAGPAAGVATAPAGSRAALGRLVARERDFLQGLASLIQEHARGFKDDLAAARSVGIEGGTAPSPGEAGPPPAPRDPHSAGEPTVATAPVSGHEGEREGSSPGPVRQEPAVESPAHPAGQESNPDSPAQPVRQESNPDSPAGRVRDDPPESKGPADEPTRFWGSAQQPSTPTPPRLATRTEVEEPAVREPETAIIVDLTAEGAGAVDPRSTPSRPAAHSRSVGLKPGLRWHGSQESDPESEDQGPPQERSVRELFWGED